MHKRTKVCHEDGVTASWVKEGNGQTIPKMSRFSPEQPGFPSTSFARRGTSFETDGLWHFYGNTAGEIVARFAQAHQGGRWNSLSAHTKEELPPAEKDTISPTLGGKELLSVNLISDGLWWATWFNRCSELVWLQERWGRCVISCLETTVTAGSGLTWLTPDASVCLRAFLYKYITYLFLLPCMIS